MGAATRGGQPGVTGRWTSGVRHERLANGLTLLVQPVPAPAVAVVTHVRAGFFDEPDHWVGISHVLEHMYFKGTPTRGPGEIARATKAAGGYLNAGTGFDHTAYYTVLPPAGLGAALGIQSDALRHPLFDSDELARELGVIIQEARRKVDTPGAVAWETLHAVMYDHHRIRRWRIGSEEILEGYRRDDLLGYYHTRYVPERTIVSVVGGIDPDEALSRAREAYGDWPARPAVLDPPVAEPDALVRRGRTLRGDVALSELVLGWRTQPPLHAHHVPLDLAAAVLSAGRASWLQVAVREPGLAQSIGAHHYGPTELGVFAIAATLAPSRLEEVLEGIAGEVRRLATDGPTEDVLERARTLVLARWSRRMESVDGRASALAAAEALEGFGRLDAEYTRLASVTAAEVQEVANHYLVAGGVSGVVYHPRAAGSDLTADLLRDAFDGAPSPRTSLSRPGMVIPRPSSTLSRPAGRTVAGVLHVPLAGADLLIRRKPGVPLVTLGVYRRRRQSEDACRAGLAALAVRSAVRGAGAFDAEGLADQFERLGGSLAPSVTHDLFGFGATVLADRLAEAGTLLRLVLLEPRLADHTIQVERALLADEVRGAEDDMFRHPIRLALSARFGDVGYGLPVMGHSETVPDLPVDLVRAWQPAELAGGRTTVLAVGDLDPHQAADQLATVFDGLAPAALDPDSRKPAPTGTGFVERVEFRDKAQTAVALVFPGADRRDRRRFAAEVWAAVAGGLGGRMFESLRSRRSLAYTVVASAWQRRHAGALLTYIATAPEREAEAREAMQEELAVFRGAAPEDAEVRDAVNYLVGQAEVSRQTSASVAAEALDAWLVGEGLEELGDPGAGYRAVSGEEIREMAEAWLDPDVMTVGVVRGGGAGR